MQHIQGLCALLSTACSTCFTHQCYWHQCCWDRMLIRTSLPRVTFCLEQTWNAIVSSSTSDWAHPPYECRVHYSNNMTKWPIYAMDLHTGCSNKNVPVTYYCRLLLVHSYGDTMVIVCIKGFKFVIKQAEKLSSCEIKRFKTCRWYWRWWLGMCGMIDFKLFET